MEQVSITSNGISEPFLDVTAWNFMRHSGGGRDSIKGREQLAKHAVSVASVASVAVRF